MWACKICTFVNHEDLKRCEMCREPPGMMGGMGGIESAPDREEKDELEAYGAEVVDVEEIDEPLDVLLNAVLDRKPKSELAAIISSCPSVDSVHEEYGTNALLTAVEQNDVDTARSLLELKADVNAVIDGETALTHAISNQIYDGTEMARMLLANGADYRYIEHSARIEQEDIENNILLRYWIDRARARPIEPERKVPALYESTRTRNNSPFFNCRRSWLVSDWKPWYSYSIYSDCCYDKTSATTHHHQDELAFGIIGEEPALRMITQAVQGFYFDLKVCPCRYVEVCIGVKN